MFCIATNIYHLLPLYKRNPSDFITPLEIATNPEKVTSYFIKSPDTKPLFFMPIHENTSQIEFETEFMIDLVAAIPTCAAAFHKSNHIEIIPKPNLISSLKNTKIELNGKLLHQYNNLLIGNINKSYELWAIFPYSISNHGNPLPKNNNFIRKFVEKFYVPASKRMEHLPSQMDIPQINSDITSFNEFYERVLITGKRYSVNSTFMDAFYDIILQKKSIDEEQWPVLYIQWPGGKQRFQGRANFELLMKNHYNQVDPIYCDNYIIDIRGVLFAKYNENSTEEKRNIPLSCMWNPDIMIKALHCEKSYEHLWTNRIQLNQDDLTIPSLLHTNNGSAEYPCYGTSCWRDIWGK